MMYNVNTVPQNIEEIMSQDDSKSTEDDMYIKNKINDYIKSLSPQPTNSEALQNFARRYPNN
jgi:hypothetical protein